MKMLYGKRVENRVLYIRQCVVEDVKTQVGKKLWFDRMRMGRHM